MSTPAPEFSRLIRLDQAISNAAGGTIAASAEERAALTIRFGLSALDSLDADYRMAEENGVLHTRGRLRARVAQPCVATGEPVPQAIDIPFVIRFLPEGTDGEQEEMELSEEDCDTVFFAGSGIDIGEAVAETLALALDPFPRAPDADAWLKKMGVKTQEQASPFAILQGLKGPDKSES